MYGLRAFYAPLTAARSRVRILGAVKRIRVVAILVLGAAAVTAGAFAGGSKSRADSRPNILVFETDDQTVESMRVLANVQRLIGAQGVTFDSSFVSFSLCCPSRATFLTGQYAHNHGVMGNKPPEGGYYKLDSSNTLPVWLQKAGYNTVHLGKYLNGYGTKDPREIPPGWSEWHGSVDPSTYRFYDFTLNENGALHTYKRRYKTDLYAEKGAEIVRRRARQAKPFFLWVAFLAPHSGGPREPGDPKYATPVPAPRHRDRLANEPLPVPASFNEADVSDKPQVVSRRRLLRPREVQAIQEMYQQRLESLLAVDEAVARVMAALRASGELDKTLVVFTSDNGYFHGEHRIPQGKVLLYEPSIRVPLLMRGPGIPRGVHLGQMVGNIDLAPTFVDAANATPGRAMDGRSLLPLVANPRLPWRDDLLLETSSYMALRTSRYLYAEYENGDRELYDLVRDPDELESKHADPAFAAVRAELATRLGLLRNCHGPGCRL